MGGASTHEITGLLQAWNDGDNQALDRLTHLVYAELYRAARRCLSRRRRGDTLQPTALINELYVKMVDLRRVSWQNRTHFFALCARVMRQILTDAFRSGRYLKRGGGAERVPLDTSALALPEARCDLVAIDEALNRLEALDHRKSQVVELRFFGGLSVKETAAILKVSPDTVMRDWKL